MCEYQPLVCRVCVCVYVCVGGVGFSLISIINTSGFTHVEFWLGDGVDPSICISAPPLSAPRGW